MNRKQPLLRQAQPGREADMLTGNSKWPDSCKDKYYVPGLRALSQPVGVRADVPEVAASELRVEGGVRIFWKD